MTILAFGPFRLDMQSELLFRGSEPVTLGRRAIALLRALVEQPGGLVLKDALIEAAWPNQAVEESNLTVQIAALRRALGAAPGGDRWIETMARRGYRYVGPIAASREDAAIAAPPRIDTPQEAAPIRHAEPERRQITALSCELVGEAAAGRGGDLEDLREAVGDFQHCVSEIAGRYDAFITRHFGNNALVLFGYPEAHEHDAERAVRAGLELCAAVRGLRPDAAVPMRCRIGIATGMVIIDEFVVSVGGGGDWEIIGETPELAEQLQISAQPDTVVIEPMSRRLIGNLFDCRELGAIAANTGAKPIRAWQVLGESIVASRFEALRGSVLSPLIGREEELDLLLRRWARAKEGDGQIVLVSGEPGIGKSRIAAALEERLQAEPHLRLRYFCSPHHQDSALFPVVDQLGRAADFVADDPPEARLDKLEALVTRASPRSEDVALLADLVSLPASDRHPLPDLSPQRKKERTFEALLRQLEGFARQQPILMTFEDAHWIDPTSRELLDLAVERVRSLPVLLIVTFRTEFQPSWTGQPQVTILALARLDRRERAALVEQIAGGKALPGEIAAQIAERADGVPLFVEELAKSVLESGLLREEPDRYVLDRALPPFSIPTTLHASLLARLDRLASARQVAQIGAAIGRDFSYELLSAVSHLPEERLQSALTRLVASELVFQRGMPPDAVYSFKHALVQDAAHGSLLRKARQQLHAQIAAALETDSPELTENQPELLAWHYAEAGLVEKSAVCWGRAGHRSVSRSAMAEAAVQFQKGLHQLELMPDNRERQQQQLEFLSVLGTVLDTVKGQAAAETGRAFASARELWERIGSPSRFLRIPYGQSGYHAMRGELDLALRLDEDLLRVSDQRADTAGLVLGHMCSGRDLMFAGRFASSRSHLEAALALYNPISHGSLLSDAGDDPRVSSQAHLAIDVLCLGFPDQALALSHSAIDEARRLAHPRSLAVSLVYGARLHSLVGDTAALDDLASELIALTAERGFPVWHAAGMMFRGWVNARNGDVAQGISLLRSGSDAYQATGTQIIMPQFTALRASACEMAGQIDEAVSLLNHALQIAERTGERWFTAELNRHRGELLQRRGHPEAAEELYLKALTIAQEQEAKLWELRAAISLARLRRDQGRRQEARNLLAPVYGWFTEGFEISDLKKASASLHELA
jgi:predicted ATPase/DNA-binding winged helix-turn-helix (wHTH) protein